MKKIVLTIVGLAALMPVLAQHQLSGHLNGLPSEKLVVRVMNEGMNAYEKTDTIAAKGGDFVYDFAGLAGCRRAVLSNVPVEEGARPSSAAVYLVEGEQCVLSGDFDEMKTSGSTFFTNMEKAEKALESYENKLVEINKAYAAEIEKEGADKAKIQEETEAKYNAALKEYQTASKAYIQANPDDESCVILCSNLEDPTEGYALLSDKVKNGKMKSYIDTMTARIKAQQEREAKRKEAEKFLQPGMPAPEITLNDLDGKPLSLSQLKGKYVIIDWWGSWCIWCIRGIPKMKEYYAKYQDKLEIFGVDCRDTQEKWKNAVKQYELPWKHVYMPSDSKLTETYAIQGYPTKCIINPDGTINKIIVGEDPKFYDYLDELLK